MFQWDSIYFYQQSLGKNGLDSKIDFSRGSNSLFIQ